MGFVKRKSLLQVLFAMGVDRLLIPLVIIQHSLIVVAVGKQQLDSLFLIERRDFK
jgi:hypothetical protein